MEESVIVNVFPVLFHFRRGKNLMKKKNNLIYAFKSTV